MGVADVPLSDCGRGKGIDRVHGGNKKPAQQVRPPLTWSILSHGYLTVTRLEEGGLVVWLWLALSYFLLCRVSELFAYPNGLVHPEFSLTRDCLTFFRGDRQVDFADRMSADSVKILFVASENDQNREGCTITRVRGPGGAGLGRAPIGAFEAIGRLLDVQPDLPRSAPLITRFTTSGWTVVTRQEAVVALRKTVACTGRDPAQYELHSGRIGSATQLAAQGMSELQIQRAGRWKSGAFMVYVRAAGEGAERVSAALAKK